MFRKIQNKALRIICVVTSLVILIPIALLLLANLLKFAVYPTYYAMEETICKNPGTNDGFVCQGICVSEEHGIILVSGYMNDDRNSRIYITDFESNSYYVSLTREGEDYTGHAGGIALTGDTVYLSNASRLFVFSLSEILNATEGDTVEIGAGVPVNGVASFVFANEEYVYVGEYNDPNGTQKEHPYDTPNGKNHAIIERYPVSDLSQPDKIYSIGDYAQGVCFTPDGDIIISTSHALTSSIYYVYSEADATDSGNTLDGAPVYFLGECKKVVKGPAMGEDLDWYDGKVITLTESASNKYVFGKFFFATDIVALDFRGNE